MTNLIRSNLLETLGNSDFFALGRSLSQLVTADLIGCPDVRLAHPIQKTILDSSVSQECRTFRQTSEFLLRGVNVDTTLVALNGSRYRVNFVSKNQSVFTWSVWGMRILGLFGIFGAFLLLRLQKKVDQLRMSTQLELATARHELAQRLAHDIRSPVTALNFSVRALPVEFEENRNVILQACRRIESIASDLLIDSRTHSGVDRTTDSVSMMDIENLLKEKRYEFSARQVEFEASSSLEGQAISSRLPRTELIRALSNVLNNSAEASTSNSTVYLEIFSVESFAHFRVTDSGSGIPEHLLLKIGNEKFTTKSEGGVGIGLYHLRKQLEAIGGQLDIRSKVGTGTQVTLKVPMN